MMQKLIVFFLFVVTLAGCGNTENEKPAPEPSGSISIPHSSHWKDLKIDSAWFAKQSKSRPALDTSDWVHLQVSRITTQPGYGPYKIFDTLLHNDTATIIALARDAENENFIWLVRYDDHQKYQQHLLVYYADFVEYYSSTQSVIRNDSIIVRQENFGADENGQTVEMKFSMVPGYGWK